MKKIFYFIALIFINFSFSNAAAQKWQWASVSGCEGRDDLRDLTTDDHGNTYILADMELPTGIYSESTAIPNGKGTVKIHTMLVSQDCNGKFRWSKVIGGGGGVGKGVKVSTSGNVYLWASVSTSPIYDAYFDTDTTVTTKQRQAMSLACYDTSGNFKWLRRPDTISGIKVQDYQQMDMDIDEDGNIYCLVSMPPGNKLMGTSLTIPSTPPFFGLGMYILKFDPNGTMLSVTMLRDFSYTFKYGVIPSIAKLTYNRFNKGYYLSCQGFADPGADSLFIRGNLVDHSIVFCSFAQDGSLKWFHTDTSTTSGNFYIPNQAKLDDSGNIFIGGNGGHKNMFNGYLFENSFCTTPNRSLPFIMKMDSTGAFKWCSRGGLVTCSGFSRAWGFSINKNGGFAAIGISGGLKNFFGDPLKDTITVNKTKPGGPGIEGWYAIVNLSDGKTVRLGAARGEGYGDGITAMHYHNSDLFMAGSVESNPFTIDSSLVITSKKATTGQDVFVAKYGLACGCTGPPASSFTYSAGTFTFTGSTPADSVHWDFGDGKTGKGMTATHAYTFSGKYKVCATVWTLCGTTTYCETTDIPVSVKESANNNSAIKIYPNPVTDRLIIDGLENGTELQLFTITGKAVSKMISPGRKVEIPMGSLTSGIYILQLSDQNGNVYNTRISKL